MRRLLRLYLPSASPLRRRSDRVEAAAFWVALALVVASLWPAVLVGSQAADRERASQALRRHTVATLLEDADRHQLSAGVYSPPRAEASARWLSPAGAERTGRLAVVAGSAAGASVPIWTDAEGRPVDPPLDEGTVTLRGIHAGVFVVVSTAALLLFAFLGLRQALNRRRYAAWELAWRRAS